MTSEARKTVLWLIAEDMWNDAKMLDGKPFTPMTIGTSFGYVMAAVMHLAIIVADLEKSV